VFENEVNKCACGCGLEIPKKHKGKKFLNKVHKDRYHNRPKTKSNTDAFVGELKALLKKYGLDR
jgi:hypothetical protein